ncbi:YdiU family protein [Massilia sp. CCM 8734]|uniref:YdiU family protein n=1 Tax=Massilia sp. CCM 8734 TaxID=2609283 RepID=UPI0014216B9E|nr:YdiU family protein [Massilia sp. CCM 8734]NHZ96300.1 hypothetical protein [Massilia sp. CCM 8734]
MFIVTMSFSDEEIQRIQERLSCKVPLIPPLSPRIEQIIEEMEFSDDDLRKASAAASAALASE